MNEKERRIRARENWLKTYQELGSITKASTKLGVSRSTMYRWINRYNQEGKLGLSDKSRRPKKLANQKVDPHLEEEILTIRKKRNWGTEFFNFKFQEELHEHFIKFRPIKPKSPHLNGKVERTQQTDKSEFWRLLDLTDRSMDFKLLAKEWEIFYNRKRPHSSLGGKTPWCFLHLKTIPLFHFKSIPL